MWCGHRDDSVRGFCGRLTRRITRWPHPRPLPGRGQRPRYTTIGDSTAASPEEFVDRAEALREAHGRKIESRSYVHSFKKEEMDPLDPQTPGRVRDLSYQVAKELHSNSDVLVIVHLDSAGGHPHSHVTVINHDNETGLALRGQDMYWQYQAVNDRVMREQGLEVVERGSRSVDHKAYWEHRREGEAVSEFDRQLGDQIEESLADRRSVDLPSYRQVLAEKGIELDEKVHTIKASADGSTQQHESIGWTYKAFDTTGEKPRKRRRKASSLSEEFTHDGAQEIFKYNQERTVRHERQGQDRAAGEGAVALGDVRIGRAAAQRAAGGQARTGSADRVPEQPHVDGGGALDVDELRGKLERARRDAEARRGEEASHELGGSRDGARRESGEQRDRAARRRKLLEEVRRGRLQVDGEDRSADHGPSL
ncbi:relaxase/mobilization nuclease domain-containing protein [Arsenicicoccus piscis]